MIQRRSVLVMGLLGLLATAPLVADTLYLRSGRKVEGALVGYRGDTIEFRERGRRGAVKQYDRREVRAIEFDDRSNGDDDRLSDAQARPGGLREREVVVSADVAWNDTGIDVRAGQTVYFAATGTVSWGPKRKDGPAGEEGSPHNPGRPIPSRPAAALIGKIGDGSMDIFFIGDDRGPVRLRAGGRLYLGVNDDYIQDNHGNFRVVIAY